VFGDALGVGSICICVCVDGSLVAHCQSADNVDWGLAWLAPPALQVERIEDAANGVIH